MSKWKYNDDECPHCKLVYRDMKTGMKFADVRMLLWVGDDDYSRWKYKRRRTVLGLWHQLKLSMWKEHLYMCEQQAMYYEAQQKFEEEFGELVDIVKKEFGDDPPERRYDGDDLADVPF